MVSFTQKKLLLFMKKTEIKWHVVNIFISELIRKSSKKISHEFLVNSHYNVYLP